MPNRRRKDELLRTSITEVATDPKRFFGSFERLVLVANSPDARFAVNKPPAAGRTLFIFFNKVFRILDQPFGGASVLVARSSPIGSNLVYRGELARAVRTLDHGNFHGILNIKAQADEHLNAPADFGRTDVAQLDLTGFMRTVYPEISRSRMPSTGFATAVWLAHLGLGVPVHLAGFTGVREEQWRVFDVHDWTWEQTVLALFYRKGLLVEGAAEPAATWPVESLLAQFPVISHGEFEAVALQILSRRLSASNRAIDRLFSAVKPQVALSRLFRRLKPNSHQTRVREALEAQANETRSSEPS